MDYTQWSDKETWSRIIILQDVEYRQASKDMQSSLITSNNIYEMHVVEDYLQPQIFNTD
jgi:predicted hydrolase (HD superfamily)